MTLRPEYSLGHSQYNEFLFAAIGEEKSGMQLTVLTAMTRLGLDPWREAARLSDMSREAAAQAFATTIAKLPAGDWKVAESAAIAARLVSWLPAQKAPSVPSVEDGFRPGREEASRPDLAKWLLWGAFAITVILLVLRP
jgi:hypothetical protein